MSENIYEFIEQYAKEKQLPYTMRALPLVKKLMGNEEKVEHVNIDGITRYRGHYEHGLLVCKLLITLVLPLKREEEDIVLAAALCHIIPNLYEFEDMKKTFTEEYQMDPQIYEIINLIIKDEDLSLTGQKAFYERIRKNRLALIVFLSDRANLVQQLYTMSMWSANQYVFETRTYFFPLCIYAKEEYPEIMPIVNILMEKVRTLVDACAILNNRYEQREMELTEDILSYQEENSRIRGFIKQLREAAEKE